MTIASNIQLTYHSLFKPTFLSSPNLRFNKNRLLFTKQFFYFIFFIQFFFNEKTFSKYSNFKKARIITYKRKKKLQGFLRAPYKHKKAQIRLYTTFYIIKLNLLFYNSSTITVTFDNFIFSTFNIFSFFDSALVTLHKQTLKFTIFYSQGLVSSFKDKIDS